MLTKATSPRLKPAKPAFSKLFPWLFLFAAYTFAILFQAKYADDFLNSDMAAEMILANELNEEGALFLSNNWLYGTELRVLYQHIFFRFGLLLFPNNWHFARIIGQAIMLALHAASFIYLMSVLGHKKAGIYGAAALMCPFGFWYTFHGIFSGAYLTHMILMSLTLGLIIDLSKCSCRQKSISLALVLAILCFFQGLNGIRMLMNLYAPLCITVILLLILRHMKTPLENPVWQDPYCKLLTASVFATAMCCFGFAVHAGYLSKTYDCVTYERTFWSSFTLSGLLEVYSHFLTLFGYSFDGWIPGLSSNGWASMSLMSLNGILSAAGVVLMIAVLFSMFRLFKLWDRLSPTHRFVALLLPVCLVVDGFVFSCLTSYYHVSYWLPLIPLVFANVTIWVLNEEFRLPHFYQGLVGTALLVCILCVCVPQSYQFTHFPPRAALNLKPVTGWLLENGYREGYASFWYSDVLTEHSDGQIEVWTLRDPEEQPVSHTLYPMLQKRSHMDIQPQGKCFVLLSQTEYNRSIEVLPYQIHEDTLVYQDDYYIVLAYDSIDEALK